MSPFSSGDSHSPGEQNGPAGASAGGTGSRAAVGARGEGEAVGGERGRAQLPHRTVHAADQPPHAASEQVVLPSAGAQEQRHPVQRHVKPRPSPPSTRSAPISGLRSRHVALLSGFCGYSIGNLLFKDL